MYLSIIPADSELGANAKKLAAELDTDLQAIKAEQEAKQPIDEPVSGVATEPKEPNQMADTQGKRGKRPRIKNTEANSTNELSKPIEAIAEPQEKVEEPVEEKAEETTDAE